MSNRSPETPPELPAPDAGEAAALRARRDIVTPHMNALSMHFDGVPHAVCFADTNGVVIALAGSGFPGLDGADIREGAFGANGLEQSISAGAVRTAACENTSDDFAQAKVTGVPVVDQAGQVLGAIGFWTRYKEPVAHPVALGVHSANILLQQFTQPTHEADASYRIIEGVSRFTAHALGNPLTGLSLSLELLATAKLPDAQQRLVDRCVRVTDRLAAYKENLGALGGSQKVQEEKVAAAEFFRAAFEAQRISDVYSTPIEVAPDAQTFSCYPALLNDAVGYLLRNATDAIPDGGTVGVRVTREGAYTRITVWDDGPGLPDAVRAKLWQTAVSSRKHGGGFGLLLVAMIVAHIHGGRVSYSPNSPTGCQFHLDLPAR